MRKLQIIPFGLVFVLTACSPSSQRTVNERTVPRSVSASSGIADKRTDFQQFLPLEGDLARYGLKAVRPQFRTGERSAVLHAIEVACQGGKAGSSEFNPRSGAGFYVNCNPRNRQLLNGYIPLDPHKRPHSERE